MKIIVTGGAGFIGSHVVDAYIKSGHQVVVIDNLSTGFKKNLNSKVRFYKADIRNAAAVEKIFKKEQPQTVNHHAAMINVVESVQKPAATLETNVIGTANILRAFGFYRRPGGKFIFASTGGAIYGNPKKIPAAEDTPPNPLSPYALSKLMAEEAAKFYSSQYDFPYLILRYPNVFGPRQNPKGGAGVVAIFGDMMKRGIRPTIFGDGSKARDYVYVGDIARANAAALKRGRNETINLGWGKLVTDKEIFETIKKELSFSQTSKEKMVGAPKHAPYRKGEVYLISLDNRRAKKVIGWRPKVKFGEGIRKTLLNIGS